MIMKTRDVTNRRNLPTHTHPDMCVWSFRWLVVQLSACSRISRNRTP